MMFVTPGQTENDDLCYLSATRALALFRQRKLSPVEVLTAQIARAERVEPEINAFTETFFETAMKAAEQAERRYMSRTSDIRPLEGLSVSIKDVLDQEGVCTSHGSIVYREHRAASDHPVVVRIKQAGGIIHARTTTSEFAFGWITASRLWGVTRNPWNISRSPGGSSGGAAASLAAGTSTLAIGADSAGSIRVPAALCGIVGYKPPHGRVPDPVEGHDTYSVIGPMARSVADCALLQNAISGVHPSDIASLRENVVLPETYPGVKGLRLAVSLDMGGIGPDAPIDTEIRHFVKQLEEQGAEIVEPAIDWPRDINTAARTHAACQAAPFFDHMMQDHADYLCDYTKWYAEFIRSCTLSDLTASIETAKRLYRALAPVLESCDALICPVILTNSVEPEQMPWTRFPINGVSVNTDYDWITTAHFNMLGELPALAVPIGQDKDGMPVGLQVVARSYDDVRAFGVAAAIEAFAKPVW